MSLTNAQWSLTQAITDVALANLDGQIDLQDYPPPGPDDASWTLLINYLRSLHFELQLSETVQMTFVALAEAGDAFAAAHHAAATITVGFPDDKTVAYLQADLSAINTALQKDQRFGAAATLAGSLAKVISQTA
ncbi:MAG: hypothetical protein WCK27_22965 [Verrucomicrobiota bacterium]